MDRGPRRLDISRDWVANERRHRPVGRKRHQFPGADPADAVPVDNNPEDPECDHCGRAVRQRLAQVVEERQIRMVLVAPARPGVDELLGGPDGTGVDPAGKLCGRRKRLPQVRAPRLNKERDPEQPRGRPDPNPPDAP